MTLTQISDQIKALWPSGIEWMDWEREDGLRLTTWVLNVGALNNSPVPFIVKDVVERIADSEHIGIVWMSNK